MLAAGVGAGYLAAVADDLGASQFSLAFPVEFLQKSHNHLIFVMKFGKVLDSSKETSFHVQE